MPLKLMYITRNPEIASIAEESGVDWIFIDLELMGKYERQGHLDTVISRHYIEDISKVRAVLKKSDLLVRINPWHLGSPGEIDRVIYDGADIVMLPYFKTIREAGKFIEHVGGNAKTCLLFETPEAVENVDPILNITGIDYIHIGLNDLHLGYRMKFMFELLIDGTVERLCDKFGAKGIPYGFGGIARLGHGTLPAEYVIAEHYRLGSEMAILSRSFCNIDKINDHSEIYSVFKNGIKDIRVFEASLLGRDYEYFEKNRKMIRRKVNEILKKKEEEALMIEGKGRDDVRCKM